MLESASPISTEAALGFLRLRILDLTDAANGPLTVAGSAALTFNGEIYNYLELRRELEVVGWTFRSTGDGEVLLKAWLEWGYDALGRLNGMWAFGLYDEKREGLLLSRDRFGEKPLFWTQWRGGIAFASEIKQLAAFPDVELTLDRRRAAGYLTTGRPYDGQSTWFLGINQLEPGGWLWVDRHGIRTGRYYNLMEAVDGVARAGSPAEWAQDFAGAMSDSVRLRLRSDVPVGTSLSAGIDSSMVLSEAMSLGHERYHAFTWVDRNRRIDESRPAERFARSVGSIWHGVEAGASEFASIWDRMTWHQETPLTSTSLFGQWKVLEAARHNGIIVVLDGQGADEILGGYNKFLASVGWSAVPGNPKLAVVAAIGAARQLHDLADIWRNGYRYLELFRRAPAVRNWVRPGLYHGERSPPIRVSSAEMRLADIERWSLPNLLAYADRSSMAHSVEMRLPFLDPAVVAMALAMPDEVLVHGGWTKWPLRMALDARAGSKPAWRRGKRGFDVSQDQWLRSDLRPLVDAWLADPHPVWRELVDWDGLRAVADQWGTRRPSPAWDGDMFQMLALERFLRVWFPV